jgi:hypothetical protein
MQSEAHLIHTPVRKDSAVMQTNIMIVLELQNPCSTYQEPFNTLHVSFVVATVQETPNSERFHDLGQPLQYIRLCGMW